MVLGRLVGSEGFDFFGWLIFPNVGFSAFSWFHGLSGFGFLLQIFCLLVHFFLNFWFFSFDIGWFLNVVGSYSRLFRFNGLISSSSRLVQLGSSWSRDQFLRSFRHCQPSLGCIIIQTNIKEIFVNL